MYQNYNYYPQSQMNRPTPPPTMNTSPSTPTLAPQSPILKGRPVSSLEEVRATGIDFDGSVFFFPDLANKRIYTKQINLDGTATLNMYELTSIPIAATTGNYVTREEFEMALQQLKSVLQPQPQLVEEKPQELNF